MILLLGIVVIKALATVRPRPRLVENRPSTTPSSAAKSTSARSWPAMPNGAPSSNRSSGHRPAPPTKELVPKGSWRDNRVTRARSGCANWPTKATSPACGSRVGDGHRPCLQLSGVHRLYRRTRTLGSTRASCHDPVLSARGAGRHRLHAWRAHLCGAPGRSGGTGRTAALLCWPRSSCAGDLGRSDQLPRRRGRPLRLGGARRLEPWLVAASPAPWDEPDAAGRQPELITAG
jgi:hypothetical protein